MTRRVLCIHGDPEVRARLTAGADGDFAAAEAAAMDDGAAQHGRRPFDVVVVQLDPAAAVVRELRQWHPEPAIVTVGDEGDEVIETALASGAHDHLERDAPEHVVERAVQRSWRRLRAARTSRTGHPPAPDMGDVRRRVGQLVSLVEAAKELIDIDEPPHTTVRSLLDQASELGTDTVQLTGRTGTGDTRTPLDLPGLIHAAWGSRSPRDTQLVVDDLDEHVHGYPGMLRTALVVLFAHALRGIPHASVVRVDTEELSDALRLRIHDDGPDVRIEERRLLFTGGEHASPMLMTVEHVAARHGGTAWLADSDVLAGGTMAVVELPRRANAR